MKELTKGRLKLRNILRLLGIILSMMFFFNIFMAISLFGLKIGGGWYDVIIYFILYSAFAYTFIDILPNDYLIPYKKYLKSLEKKK